MIHVAANSKLSQDYIQSLKNICYSDYHISSLVGNGNKENVAKKFNYFINKTKGKINLIIKRNDHLKHSEDKLFNVLLKNLLSNNASSYLELQDIQAIIELLD